MKIGLLQLNPTVGAIRANAALIEDGVRRAAGLGADLVVSTELSLLGYPPWDLLLNDNLIAKCWRLAEDLAQRLAGAPPVLIGLPEPNDEPVGRSLYNACVLLRNGRIEQRFRKTLLPTYDVFDEDRYFEPAPSANPILEIKGRRLGVTICEDVWNDSDFWQRPRYHTDPVAKLAERGVEAVINVSSSPFNAAKGKLRQDMISAMAAKHKLPIMMINQVGGNDDLVFDGRSMVCNASGELVARAKAFAEDLVVIDFDRLDNPDPDRIADDDRTPEAEIWQALVLGTRDYAAKCGFKTAILGLSGGIDSSLTAAAAVDALGPDQVTGVMMPSPYSSRGSITDSQALAANLGIKTLTIPIKPAMDAFKGMLTQAFAGLDEDVTEENIQARIRGNLMMSLSNKYRSLLLTTGNKSEAAVGYCTLYGDMSGGLAVISDVPKTMVYRICEWLNAGRGREVIPRSVITKPPSAELKPGQTDQDSLPPYDILDRILELHIEGRKGAEEIEAAGFDRETVDQILGLVHRAEFKRQQAAPGIKVTDRAFGVGWRMPIAKGRG